MRTGKGNRTTYPPEIVAIGIVSTHLHPDPAFDFLHAEPRYRSLIQKMGLPSMY